MFEYHTPETVPQGSLDLLERSKKDYGFYPKLHQVMAEAPSVYEAYLETFRLFTQATDLSPTEQQVVMMTVNYLNECHYCMAGHTMLMKMVKVPDDAIAALRVGGRLNDPKLEALRVYTRTLVEQRGHIGDDALKAFLAAGYSKRQALEVLVGIAAKTLSNFTNALAHTELDEPVKQFAWKKEPEMA
ncbi:carboxymuconolactone decarboxylase family protein [Roseibium sp.]|uniref:carboxymuconolactone decarboxylase family protein n=1 Tax=Roseibium sp. TaxID=1936156 RepID=UPI001B00A9C1|nr:carboxymuconolactone decarboxylase family protein [Roseibium sp.]MBO6856609.1 carboxymuconolactone decarboxylase family protein [Roseibium sp.]